MFLVLKIKPLVVSIASSKQTFKQEGELMITADIDHDMIPFTFQQVSLYSDPPEPSHCLQSGLSHDASKLMTLDISQAQRAQIQASHPNGHSSHQGKHFIFIYIYLYSL